MNFIPKYIRQQVNNSPRSVVTSDRWNELWNLAITQGDYNSETLDALINGPGAESIGANPVKSGGAGTVQGILEQLQADKADKTNVLELDRSNPFAPVGPYNPTTKKYVDDINATVVHKTGNETIEDTKTFTDSPIVPAPTTDMQAATKKYVDDTDGARKTYVDNLDALAVHLAGTETITGVKTFSASPIVPAPVSDTHPATKKYVDDADALKVNITDIVNDLTTGGTAVPLSAEQGKVLKENSDTHIADTLKHKQAASIVQSGILANAEGYVTKAYGYTSHAEGNFTIARGEASHAEGYNTEASGEASHAEGQFSIASGNYAHAEGYLTVALGANSHAEGVDTEAGAGNAHAEGASTKALGGASHAEGAGTETSGDFAHAEGQGTKAIGQASHAEGAGAEAKGAYSHAGGEGTIAKGYAQTAIGVFNVEQGTEGAKAATDHALIIGNGTDEARANALAVKWNGDTDIAGDMNIASGKKYKINNTDLSASDVGAVPTTRKVNNKALSDDITLSASNVGAVPTIRKVNNITLNYDVSFSALTSSAGDASIKSVVPVGTGSITLNNGTVFALYFSYTNTAVHVSFNFMGTTKPVFAPQPLNFFGGFTYFFVYYTDNGGHFDLITTTKASVGLSKVDNTADKDKPISTAVAGAMGDLEYLNTTEKSNLVGAINELNTDKIETSAITNTLTETAEGKVLDARQGKVLADLVNTKTNTALATVSLTAAGWAGDNAPYTRTYSNEAITATNPVELFAPPDITVGQLEALQAANIQGGTQSTGSIVLRAFGEKPTIDVPVAFIIRRDL